MYGLPDSAIVGTIKRLSRRSGRGGGVSRRGGGGAPSTSFSFKFKDIEIFDQALHIELHTSSGGLWKAIETKLRPLMVADARKGVGVRTGKLRSNIRWYHLGNFYGQYFGLRTDLRYGLLHHEGTSPHKIVATPNNRAGGMLVFPSRGGGIVRTRSVNHPGTSGNPFLRRTLRHVRKL